MNGTHLFTTFSIYRSKMLGWLKSERHVNVGRFSSFASHSFIIESCFSFLHISFDYRDSNEVSTVCPHRLDICITFDLLKQNNIYLAFGSLLNAPFFTVTKFIEGVARNVQFTLWLWSYGNIRHEANLCAVERPQRTNWTTSNNVLSHISNT